MYVLSQHPAYLSLFSPYIQMFYGGFKGKLSIENSLCFDIENNFGGIIEKDTSHTIRQEITKPVF